MHPQSTGIFIPAHKKGVFIVAFEKILLDRHNIITTFEESKNGSSCEVKFKCNKYNQESHITRYHCKIAKKLLKENLFLIEENKNSAFKNAMPSFNASSNNRNLVNNPNDGPIVSPRRLSLRSSSTIDLTGDSFQGSEPEVIVLDDCLDHTISHRNRNKKVDIIDLDDSLKSLPMASNRTECDIQVLGIKNLKPSVCSMLARNEVKVTRSVIGQKNNFINLRRSKRKSNSVIETPKQIKKIKLTNSEQRLTYNSKDSKLSEAPESNVKKSRWKKRKLCDVSNVIQTASPKADIRKTKPLSDGVLKYYTDISKAINKKRKSKSPKRKNLLNRVFCNKESSLSQSVKKPKAKSPNHTRKLYFPSFTRSPGSYKQRVSLTRNVKCKHESNIFNPNPNVDVDGLRPIAIDGSNIAVGHGKGTFSTKGLKICVDYFVNQGHKTVKVFLPLHRQDCFSNTLLEELRSKCDMVFTPSREINGRRTTSYDDRFIVQYAVEFGAVIVSTDNFRDLLAENPRWTKTIQERLLMFTWIDDFLMFPMDPLGKNGPTLDEFLKF